MTDPLQPAPTPSPLSFAAPPAERRAEAGAFAARLDEASRDERPRRDDPPSVEHTDRGEKKPRQNESSEAKESGEPRPADNASDSAYEPDPKAEPESVDEPSDDDGLLEVVLVSETLVFATSAGATAPAGQAEPIEVTGPAVDFDPTTAGDAAGGPSVFGDATLAADAAGEAAANAESQAAAEAALADSSGETTLAAGEGELTETLQSTPIEPTDSTDSAVVADTQAPASKSGGVADGPVGPALETTAAADPGAEAGSDGDSGDSGQEPPPRRDVTPPPLPQPATPIDDTAEAPSAEPNTPAPTAGAAEANSSRAVEAAANRGPEPAPAVDPARFVSRVARAIDFANERGGGPIEMRLSPPELGSLQVKIELKEGVLTASFEAETPAARQTLLDNLPALRDRLEQQQIRIDKFDVDVRDDTQQRSGGEGRPDGDAQQRPGERQDRREPAPPQRVELNEPTAPAPAVSTIDFGDDAINLVA